MSNLWNTYTLAEELLKLLPNLGRLLAVFMRESGEEETTLMQIGVLMRLQEQPITTSELAKSRRVSLQAASALIQGMVERGWVLREPDPNDRRQWLLQITPEGAERARTAREQVTRHLAGFLNDISPEEMAAAQIFLPAISRVLTQQITPDDGKHDSTKEEMTSL
jgi:DNA-binding MarR family transcriptional regulator